MSIKGTDKLDSQKEKQEQGLEVGTPPTFAPPPPPPQGDGPLMAMPKPLDISGSTFEKYKNIISLKAQTYNEYQGESDAEDKALLEAELKADKIAFEKEFFAIDEIADLIGPTLPPKAKCHLGEAIAEFYKRCDNPEAIQELEGEQVDVQRILQEGHINFEAIKIIARLVGSETTRLESAIKESHPALMLAEKTGQLALLRKQTKESNEGNRKLLAQAEELQLPGDFIKEIEADIEQTEANFKRLSVELQEEIADYQEQIDEMTDRKNRLKDVLKHVFNKAKGPFLEVNKAYPSFKKNSKKKDQQLKKTVDFSDAGLKQLLSPGVYFKNLVNFIILDDENVADFTLDTVLGVLGQLTQKPVNAPIDEVTLAWIASGYLTRQPGTCNRVKPLEGAQFDDSRLKLKDLLLKQIYEAMPKLRQEALAIAQANTQDGDVNVDVLVKQGNAAILAQVSKANGGHVQAHESSARITGASSANGHSASLRAPRQKAKIDRPSQDGKKASIRLKKHDNNPLGEQPPAEEAEDFRAVTLKSTVKTQPHDIVDGSQEPIDRKARQMQRIEEIQAQRDAKLKEMALAGDETQFGKRGATKFLRQCENELQDIQAVAADVVIEKKAQVELDKLKMAFSELELKAAQLEQAAIELEKRMLAQEEENRLERERLAKQEQAACIERERLAEQKALLSQREEDLSARDDALFAREQNVVKREKQAKGSIPELIRGGDLLGAFTLYKQKNGRKPNKYEATKLISQNISGARERKPLVAKIDSTLSKLK